MVSKKGWNLATHLNNFQLDTLISIWMNRKLNMNITRKRARNEPVTSRGMCSREPNLMLPSTESTLR